MPPVASIAPGTFRATLWVLLSACCFGSVSPLTMLATNDGASLQLAQLLRYGTSALLLGVVAARVRARDVEARSRPPAWRRLDLTLFGGGAQFLVAALSLSALRWLPAATIGFLFYTYPAWVTMLSALRRIEPITTVRVVALVLALAGVAAMVGAPGAAMPPVGVALALAAAMVYAVYIPTMSIRQRGETPVGVAFAVALGGTAYFLIWCIASGALGDVPSLRVVLLGTGMGVLTAFAFLGFLTGLAGLGPVRAAIMSTIEPVWTAVLGLLALGQPLGLGTLFGGTGILAAVLLLQRPVRTKS